ncbi:MAG: hypothetical protein IPG74_18725 [Flavobacteriales bacterium]|nr:hypothetical protein [Flavobacteriales bacterium]
MTHIEAYFRGEKAESLLFLAIGIAAIAFAVFAWLKWNEPFVKGMAVPLIVIGLIQMTVGGTVFARTDKQVSALNAQAAHDAQAYRSAELPRMEKVMKSFTAIKWTEIVFVLTGIGLLMLTSTDGFWKGLGLGLMLQGSVSLTLDVFAEKRGAEYITAVEQLSE